MLDCFNEGFSDEESIAASFTQIPKVYLSFGNIHLRNDRPTTRLSLIKAAKAVEETIGNKNSAKRRLRHSSAQTRHEKDDHIYIQAETTVKDYDLHSKRPMTQSFVQFKKAFAEGMASSGNGDEKEEELFNFKNVSSGRKHPPQDIKVRDMDASSCCRPYSTLLQDNLII